MDKNTNIKDLETLLKESEVEQEIYSILEELEMNDAPDAIEAGEADEKEADADREDYMTDEEEADDVKEVVTESADEDSDKDDDDKEEVCPKCGLDKENCHCHEEDEEENIKESEELAVNDAPDAIEAGDADEIEADADKEDYMTDEEEADDVKEVVTESNISKYLAEVRSGKTKYNNIEAGNKIDDDILETDLVQKEKEQKDSKNESYSDFELMKMLDEAGYEPSWENVAMLREELATNDAPEAIEAGDADEIEVDAKEEDYHPEETEADDVKEVVVESLTDFELMRILDEAGYEPSWENVAMLREALMEDVVEQNPETEEAEDEGFDDGMTAENNEVEEIEFTNDENVDELMDDLDVTDQDINESFNTIFGILTEKWTGSQEDWDKLSKADKLKHDEEKYEAEVKKQGAEEEAREEKEKKEKRKQNAIDTAKRIGKYALAAGLTAAAGHVAINHAKSEIANVNNAKGVEAAAKTAEDAAKTELDAANQAHATQTGEEAAALDKALKDRSDDAVNNYTKEKAETGASAKTVADKTAAYEKAQADTAAAKAKLKNTKLKATGKQLGKVGLVAGSAATLAKSAYNDKKKKMNASTEENYEGYTSLSEAFALGSEYFAVEANKQTLVEQVSLSIASENDDRLFVEMVNATVLANKLRNELLEKYADVSLARVDSILEELAVNDAPEAIEAGEATEIEANAKEEDYMTDEEEADDVKEVVVESTDFELMQILDEAGFDTTYKNIAVLREELATNDAPIAIEKISADELAFKLSRSDYMTNEINSDDVKEVLVEATISFNDFIEIMNEEGLEVTEENVESILEELATNDAPIAIEVANADETVAKFVYNDYMTDETNSDDVKEVLVESFDDYDLLCALDEAGYDADQSNLAVLYENLDLAYELILESAKSKAKKKVKYIVKKAKLKRKKAKLEDKKTNSTSEVEKLQIQDKIDKVEDKIKKNDEKSEKITKNFTKWSDKKRDAFNTEFKKKVNKVNAKYKDIAEDTKKRNDDETTLTNASNDLATLVDTNKPLEQEKPQEKKSTKKDKKNTVQPEPAK